MVSFDTAATISLILVLSLIVLLNRQKLSFSRWTIFFAAMYRSKAGISTMDKIAARWKKFWHASAPWIIGIGFLGMILVVFDLGTSLVRILTEPGAPSVGVVLPIQAKGVFYVPFVYWILSVFIILVMHEGMHGIMARAYNLPVKNSGLVVLGALIPLIPGAFVEPDEKKLIRAPRKHQLAVYAAGPAINIVTGLVLLLFSLTVINPVSDTFYSKDGVVITELMEGNPPAVQEGLQVGDKITHINGQMITNTEAFSEVITNSEPGQTINVITAHSVYDVTLGQNPNTQRAWFGVYVENELLAPTWTTHVFFWLKDFIFWLYVLSLGVGLFNLIPLGPIDGGRMLLCALQGVTHDTRAVGIWKTVSVFVLGVVLTNVVLAFV